MSSIGDNTISEKYKPLLSYTGENKSIHRNSPNDATTLTRRILQYFANVYSGQTFSIHNVCVGLSTVFMAGLLIGLIMTSGAEMRLAHVTNFRTR